MLHITIPEKEFFNNETQEFVKVNKTVLSLEHSLVSLSKWESKWHKPFLDNKTKTDEEILDYIKCMTLTQNVNPDVYKALTNENLLTINKYLNDPMTATTFSDNEKRGSRGEIITSELIYYWMVALQIPFECQKWHINRLITLVKICNIKNQPPKKLSRNEIYARNKALNNARKQKLNTRG